MNSVPIYAHRARITVAVLYLLSAWSLCEAETYLDRLKPIVHLRLDKTPAARVELSGGAVLFKSPKFADTMPQKVKGPHNWTGDGWDFSKCPGPFLLKTSKAMSRVGDIKASNGFTVSFWCKGSYTGKHSRIMTGPFDIGSERGGRGVWGGSNDCQTVHMNRKLNAWDNKWHNVVILVDFRSNSGNVRVYLDGAFAGARNAVYVKSVASQVGRNWTFGSRNASDAGFDYGALADIAVFDRPLADAEIGYISAGPVYAGPDCQTIITGSLKLSGFAPKGGKTAWRKLSGPGQAMFKNAARDKTEVAFSKPGDYRLELTGRGAKSSLNVKVLPNQPPKVFAGDGITLGGEHAQVKLQGSVSDDSIARGGKLSASWSLVAAPQDATVKFADPTSPQSRVTLKGEGLYTLRLTGDDGELTSSSDVNILVGARSKTSYLKLLRPIFLMGFETPARKTIDPMIDDVGDTGMKLRRPERGMPRMEKGARDFTGYAWDFSASDSDIEIINGPHLCNLYKQDHPGRSLSFWIKGDAKTAGHICAVLGITNLNRGSSLSSHSHRTPGLIFQHGSAVLAGKWRHVALVATTTGGVFERKLYLDGKQVAGTKVPIPSPWWKLESEEIRHSKFIASRGRSGTDSFNGQLDDFAVFDYALTPKDIAYIIGGPSDADKAVLKQTARLDVNAGANLYIRLPAPYKVKLNGTAKGAEGLKPRWTMISGDGNVKFADSGALSTSAAFTPIENNKDRKYSKFVLRLSMLDANGREAGGDNVTVLFYPKRAPAIRKLTETPPPGEHPRIFFTKADLPELQRRAVSVPVAKRAFDAMKQRTDSLYNPNTAAGSLYRTILTGGKFSIEPVYLGNQGGFHNSLMEAAYVAWIGTGGKSDAKKLGELAKVFAASCNQSLTWYRANHRNALCHDVNWAVGICYDLLYNSMDVQERKYARSLLARMTRHRASVGAALMKPQRNSTNWRGFHDHLAPTALAIEGQPGFDPKVIDSTERKTAGFMTQYGIFDSGLPHEGYAYYTFGMIWMSPSSYAISRRDNRENLMETTRFYKSIETAFRMLDRDGIRSHHDVVGDARTGAGLIDLPPRQVLIAKHLWPEDRMIDYLWARLSSNLLKAHDGRFTVFHAFLGSPVRYPNQSLKQAAGDRKPTIFCPDRGFAMARDRWDKNALRLDFRCRMDKYELGHIHSDVNSFELWANNRAWIIDRGKFGGTVQEAQSCILIDGISAFSAGRNSWPSSPGKFVEFTDGDIATIACGDAKPFFEWSIRAPASGPVIKVQDHGLTWSHYYFRRPGEVMPKWMKYTSLSLDAYGNEHPLYKMNPVKQSLRTVAMVKGPHPFVVIADDYRKDDKTHDYLWMANVPHDDQITVVSQNATSMVLRHTADRDGPFLLVKVLGADGLTAIRLNRKPYRVGKESHKSVRIEIPCKNVVAPNYRVLLYPYRKGDPQPRISEKNNRFEITIGNQARSITFKKDKDNRTRLKAEKN